MDIDALRFSLSRTKMAFLSLLYATYIYYHGDVTGAASGIIDLPGDSILSHYDFIVVGGGSAGAVLANRLTKVNGWSVLLIEAGDYETILTDVPVLAANHQLSKIDWNFTTEPQDTDVVLI